MPAGAVKRVIDMRMVGTTAPNSAPVSPVPKRHFAACSFREAFIRTRTDPGLVLHLVVYRRVPNVNAPYDSSATSVKRRSAGSPKGNQPVIVADNFSVAEDKHSRATGVTMTQPSSKEPTGYINCRCAQFAALVPLCVFGFLLGLVTVKPLAVSVNYKLSNSRQRPGWLRKTAIRQANTVQAAVAAHYNMSWVEPQRPLPGGSDKSLASAVLEAYPGNVPELSSTRSA